VFLRCSHDPLDLLPFGIFALRSVIPRMFHYAIPYAA
jgi:hypothetical protein